ncbi:RNA 2',3'-cyclic phosphodiesterase [Tichowtungia aerotolerans]|uniref:RNA 2',3'-cyclic phosphodiesterase n=1 Tax=Tichowtungia aerotolerans TaxID=2697043 RepID=A0A6P1M6G7_9BACT|nr:RNA 2',3'-cyclic phosphodiesterase [Tichowtungia aerotolerans]QHI69612.1 RNA 2',3'-cyclic phosphodiesterase [Tichowtungia aerotolerans]
MTTSSTETIRAFIAARPNAAVQAELVRVQRELRKTLSSSSLRIKWTDPETFHITLLFLGDIPAADADSVFQALELTASRHRCFSSCLREVGVFKKSGAVWAGIAVPPELIEFRKALASALDFEPGRFHAHFTLGRIKAGRPDQDFFHSTSGREAGAKRRQRNEVKWQTLENFVVEPVPFDISSIELIRSELLPDGARHTVLGSAMLR